MHKIFGNKEVFAIEVEIEKKVEKSKLRVWIDNTPLGYFKRKGELIYSIQSLKRLLGNQNDRFENEFLSMTAQEIFDWLRLKNIPEYVENAPFNTEQRLEFKRRYNTYLVFWGDQLDEFSTFCYVYDKKIYWIIKKYSNNKHRFLDFSTSLDTTIPVIEEYIAWYEGEYGVVNAKGGLVS